MVKISTEDEDVSLLTDEQLFQQLRQLGVNVGPIVGSTRKVYERKLARLLQGDENFHEMSSQSSYDEDDDDDDNIVNSHSISTHPEPPSSPMPSAPPTLSHQDPILENLRSPSPTGDYTVRSRKSINHNSDRPSSTTYSYAPSSQTSPITYSPTTTTTVRPVLSWKAWIIRGTVVVTIIFIIFLIYHNMENSNMNPIPRVEFK